MPYTDDPVRDYESYDRERAEREAHLPHCEYCGAALDTWYNINGEIICLDCLNENYKQHL